MGHNRIVIHSWAPDWCRATSPIHITLFRLLARFPLWGSWAERGSSAQVLQTSTFSAISRASSTSTPRYRTVLSIFVWPSSS